MKPHRLHETFADPPRAFGIMPFWFWNDDLDEAELIRQIREFHAKGFGGFVPQARIGLSRRVGYLTDEFFRLMRVAVDEAARLGTTGGLGDLHRPAALSDIVRAHAGPGARTAVPGLGSGRRHCRGDP